MYLRTAKRKKARSGTFWHSACMCVMCGYHENSAKILHSYQRSWLISLLRSWSLLCHCLHWPHVTFWLLETLLSWVSFPNYETLCWSLWLCVLDSIVQPYILGLTARPHILGFTARLSVPASTPLSCTFFLIDQRPWSLLSPTSGLVGSCGPNSLCGLHSKIDRQRKTFQTIWCCSKMLKIKSLL